MSGQQNETPARKRFPAFWGDIPLRQMAIRTHRQMTLHAAIALMKSQLGRAPSRSALARFWKALDEDMRESAKQSVSLLREYRARINVASDAHAALKAADEGRVGMYIGTVSSAGLITVPGRRYWSDDLCSRAGMEVEIHLDLDGPYASVWTKGRQHRLCTAALLEDGPFADAMDLDAMREAARKLRAERASVVRGQIAELLHIVDQRVERAILRAEARQARARQYRIADIPRLLRATWNFAFQDGHMRQQESAQSVDLDLEKIEAVLSAGWIGLFGHSMAPSADDTAEPATTASSLHRLSETPE